MSEQKEARITLRLRPDGKTEVGVYFPANRREVRTGLKAGPTPSDVDRQIRTLRESLWRSGHRVTVVEVGD